MIIGEDPTPDERGITFEVMKVPGRGWGGAAGWRGVIRLPVGVMPLPGGPAPAAVLTAGPVAKTPEAAVQSAAKTLANNPTVMNTVTQGLQALGPYGTAAAAVLNNPLAKKVLSTGLKEGASAVASGLSKLKFW